MSVIGELQRYLEGSIELLAPAVDPALVDLLASAKPFSADDLPSSAKQILDALELHSGELATEEGSPGLSGEAIEAMERLDAICRIILGR